MVSTLARSPPGVDLDLSEFRTKNQPLDTWRRVQEAGSLVQARIGLLGVPALATRMHTARQVLEDESRFTVDATRVGRKARTGAAWWVPTTMTQLADNLLVHEGDAHRRLRKRVDLAFRSSALQRMEPAIERQTTACLENLARAPSPCFVRDVARPLPLRVISDLLGLDPAHSAPDTPTGKALARLSSIRGPASLVATLPALRHLSAMLTQELDARRRNPRDDLLSALVGQPTATDPLSPREALSMVFLLYLAGHETTTHFLSCTLLTLLRTESGLASLPAELDARAVSELIRITSPVELSKPRFVVQDTELDGYALKKGSTVAALIGAANQDDRIWRDPDRIDYNRRASRHLGFGAGTHLCLGMQLALRESISVFTRVRDEFPNVALHEPDTVHWARRTGLRALSALPVRLGE